MFFRLSQSMPVTGGRTDRGTDGRTDRQNYDPQDRASIAASRGKNAMPTYIDLQICGKYNLLVLKCHNSTLSHVAKRRTFEAQLKAMPLYQIHLTPKS